MESASSANTCEVDANRDASSTEANIDAFRESGAENTKGFDTSRL